MDNTIIGGHQRVSMLMEDGVSTIECWIPDRKLTEREVEELNIRLNKNNGDWDFDILANMWEIDDLLSWGFSDEELGLEKTPKPKKEPKPAITIEFSDRDTMFEYLDKCEDIAQSSSAKIKIRG